MKRLALFVSMIFMVCSGVFAQADLQPLATVKLNKSETITLKQLKNRVEIYGKQNGISSFTVEQKKEILDAMIDEKLVVQAATKAGMVITDTQVNQYFLQNISQQIGKDVTEAEFEEIIKQNTGKSLDEYMKNSTGMELDEYKAYLKNQLIAQQYILQQKQADIQKTPYGAIMGVTDILVLCLLCSHSSRLPAFKQDNQEPYCRNPLHYTSRIVLPPHYR